MRRAILLSIRPKWYKLIATGKKTVEIRKTRPKLKTPFKVYIYETKGKEKYDVFEVPKDQGGGVIDIIYHEGSGKIIGEFVCDRIDEYKAEFCDLEYDSIAEDCAKNDIRKVVDYDDVVMVYETGNEQEDPNNCALVKNSQVTFEEIRQYIGETFYDRSFFGWHISNFVIYDEPKELSRFYRKCEKMPCEGCEHLKYQKVNQNEYDYDCEYLNYKIPITRPPQSWCYVEEV